MHIDFETYSSVELPERGLDNYATDGSTGIHCMAYAMGDEDPAILTEFEECPAHIRDWVESGRIVYAHNAAFELALWNAKLVPKGWPPLLPEQMRCTLAMAYAMGLPGSLENAAAAVGIDMQKDMKGSRVMLQLARQKVTGGFWSFKDSPAKFERLYEYCKQDVRTERGLLARLSPLSDEEQQLWVLDYRINQRGMRVDLPAIQSAIDMVGKEQVRLNDQMLKTTGGIVSKCTETQVLKTWIESQEVTVASVAKADVLELLKDKSLPPAVAMALSLRREAGKSSAAKYQAMKQRVSPDGRVRGCFQYHGAATGRWAHRGVQPGNLPRPRDSRPAVLDDIHQAIATGSRDYLDIFHGPVLDALADGIRGMIIASPHHDLVAMDFSAIEARVLAWLAGEENTLEVFRSGGDVYLHAAAGIFKRPITKKDKEERQIGKVAVLALGYGGGAKAFQAMAKAYNVKVDDKLAETIKKEWRRSNDKIVKYWNELEAAALDAIDFDAVRHAGPKERRVSFRKKGSFLWCRLPSGRVLCYPYPRSQESVTPWGEYRSQLHYQTVNSVTRKWEETPTYGGALAENVTQAVSRDLLAGAICRLEAAGYPVVLHVHDEAVVEVPESNLHALDDVQAIMSQVPLWANGLPIAAEGWRAKRYRK